MSHHTKPTADRPKAKTSSASGATQSSRPKKQTSEMLQRWKVEARKDVPFTEKIFVQSQDQGQGSRR